MMPNFFTSEKPSDEDDYYFIPEDKVQVDDDTDTYFRPEDSYKTVKQEEEEDSTARSVTRTVLAPFIGFAHGTTPALLADMWQLMAMGEAFDPEEIDRLQAISEREGVPFDRDEYIKAANNAISYIPSLGNYARTIEEFTGVPLEAKTPLQKFLQLSGLSFRATPGATSQKAVAAGVAPTTSQALQATGYVPEPIADVIGLGVGGGVGQKVPATDVSFKKTKPSGMVERQYENLKAPTEITESRMNVLNDKVKQDFHDISEKILEKSPINSTRGELRENPTYKLEVEEYFDTVQNIADKIPEKFPATEIQDAIIKRAESKKGKGLHANDYDKDYQKIMKQIVSDFTTEEASAGQLVHEYRKNNRELSSAYDPYYSRTYNSAKKDALLDVNHIIAETIEKKYPGNNLEEPFKANNKKFSLIRDAEFVDEFIEDIFKNGVDHNKANEFFKNKTINDKFKRALGDHYKDYEQLMMDLVDSKSAYKNLRIAKENGFKLLYELGAAYLLPAKAGAALATGKFSKEAWKRLTAYILDKPKLAVNFQKGVEALEKGDYNAASKTFRTIEGELETPPKASPKPKKGETIEVTGERINPENQKVLPGKPKELPLKQ